MAELRMLYLRFRRVGPAIMVTVKVEARQSQLQSQWGFHGNEFQIADVLRTCGNDGGVGIQRDVGIWKHLQYRNRKIIALRRNTLVSEPPAANRGNLIGFRRFGLPTTEWNLQGSETSLIRKGPFKFKQELSVREKLGRYWHLQEHENTAAQQHNTGIYSVQNISKVDRNMPIIEISPFPKFQEES